MEKLKCPECGSPRWRPLECEEHGWRCPLLVCADCGATVGDTSFGPVIDRYTDADALRDGVLVDLSSSKVEFLGRPVNRMTRNLWYDLKPFVEAYEDFLNVADRERNDCRARVIAEILRTKLRYATGEGNLWKVPPNLWLVANEVGGWTLMYPEDY